MTDDIFALAIVLILVLAGYALGRVVSEDEPDDDDTEDK